MAQSDKSESATAADTESSTAVTEVEDNSTALALRRLNVVRIDDADLRAWDNIETAMAAFESQQMAVYLASEVIGSGYAVMDKRELVNIRMLLVTWRFVNGEQGPFVVVTGITAELPARRFIFTDGSTGVYRQLYQETQRRIEQGIPHINAGLLVNKGLVVSEYTVEVEDKKTGEIKEQGASTYYLSTS